MNDNSVTLVEVEFLRSSDSFRSCVFVDLIIILTEMPNI